MIKLRQLYVDGGEIVNSQTDIIETDTVKVIVSCIENRLLLCKVLLLKYDVLNMM